MGNWQVISSTMSKNIMWVVVGALIVVIFAGILFSGRNNSGNGDQPEQDGNGGNGAPVHEETNVAFLADMMPEEWSRFRNASQDIDDLTPMQDVAFFVVEDPVNEDTAYFAAYAYDTDEKEQSLGIYMYDEPSYAFERIYKKTYGEGDVDWMTNPSALPVWHLVGYDHGKLIVLMQDYDLSPGPCAEPFLVGVDNEKAARLFTLDLASPSAGLSPYTPNDGLLREAQAKQDGCAESMN